MSVIYNINNVNYPEDDYSHPSEDLFRDAWALDPGTTNIVVDMELAKELWRTFIRFERIPLLDALDTEFMRAVETGANTADIVARKQALRDAPNLDSIEAATTPDELKAIQPISGVTIE